jgi:hypothetical protein
LAGLLHVPACHVVAGIIPSKRKIGLWKQIKRPAVLQAEKFPTGTAKNFRLAKSADSRKKCMIILGT